MQVTDTVHYIVAVKRKADEMDVKDKEMTIELEDVSEESKEQTEECSDKKQRHKRNGNAGFCDGYRGWSQLFCRKTECDDIFRIWDWT